MRLRIWAIMFFVLILAVPVLANYSEADLWILEIIVNEDLASSQVTDGLILENQVLIPLSRVANIVKVPLNVDYERGIYSFERPGNLVPVIVDYTNGEVRVEGQVTKQEMYFINGELFMTIETIGQILDAELKFVEQHQVVYLYTKHLEKREKERGTTAQGEHTEEERPVFSISNINYRWNIQWEKSCRTLEILGANPDEGHNDNEQGEEATVSKEVEESWKTGLRLDVKGTMYDWKYWLGGDVSKSSDGPYLAELNRYLLTYDMDKSRFYVGKLNVNTENELNLKNTAYDGISLVSRVSPLYRMNGNLIQVTGSAPKGSKVRLSVNQWRVADVVVKDDERYTFEDVLLSYNNMVNEVKVYIKKPGGEIEEIYRYISISDSVLDKGEVNYLFQAGKLKNDDCSGNYVLNSIVYWGITDQTTLGMAWYNELENQEGCIEDISKYSYNSLRINQRIDDNWILSGALYNTQSSESGDYTQDMGYKANLDYKDPNTQLGIEYHKEGQTFKKDVEFPVQAYRLYLIQNVDQNGLLEAKLTTNQSIENPVQRQHHMEVGYKTGGEKWDSSIVLTREVSEYNDVKWQNSVRAALGYLVHPNVRLLQDVKYKAKWNQMFTEEIGAGVQGVWELDSNTFIIGVDWQKNLTKDHSVTDYNLSWLKHYDLGEKQYLSTKLGYDQQVSDGSCKHTVPVSVQYNYVLPNDARLQLSYQGKWSNSDLLNEVDHKVMLSLEGAFNFFGGKLTSTSPHSAGGQIGVVSGLVFRDTNRNGQYDEGEKPLAGIPVRLGRKVQMTDAQGKFSFKQIPHGIHYLGFDYSQLPIELTPSTTDKNIKVVANGEVQEYLGLYVVGAVDGMIKVAGLPEDLTLHGIKVVANPGGYGVYTDRSGYYYFDQLPPGDYQISLDNATLPAWIIQPSEVKSQKITITDAGEYISGIDFEFQVNPEYLKQKEEKVEVITVEPKKEEPVEPKKPVAPEEQKPEPVKPDPVPETTHEIEERLVEVKDNILRVDLSNRTAVMNGEELEINPFFIIDEKIWAPIRAIAQLFNSRVYWDPENQMIYIVDDEKNILFDIKLGYVMINGEEVELKDGIQMINDFSFISIEDLDVIGLSADFKDNMLYIYQKEE